MAAKMEKTRTPGIYKRGSRYVFAYRVDGKQRWESCRTLDEARRAKAARTTDIGRGEFEERSRITLHEYAREWVERYQGTGRRGFREETRSEYRGLLDKYALSHFPAQAMLTEITPRHIASFVGWLCEQTRSAATKEDPDRRVPLSDKTVRNALGPLKACLATARREGLIRHNPATDVALPHRARVDDDDDRPRPFPRIEGDDGEPIETMELVVEHVHESHRLMFELLAATGLRRSELLVLEGRHLALDGDRPHVKVRQRVRRRRGEGLVIGPLKSRYSKRDVPIPRASRLFAEAGTSCRCSAGSGTTRPASRSTPTFICSTTTSVSRCGSQHHVRGLTTSISRHRAIGNGVDAQAWGVSRRSRRASREPPPAQSSVRSSCCHYIMEHAVGVGGRK
ncbi:MAG: phage integrase SAM-like domain-containing protein [Solirubrobacteraceae bacterium]